MNKKLMVSTMGVGALAFFAIIGYSVYAANHDSNRELQLLTVIMRHGERTPASTYPNDPHINETLFPIGWGQLTNKGKLAVFNTGKFLRSRYNNFLGSFYSSDIFYAQCTDVDRTKQTIQLVNAGLWPPNKDQKWGPLSWQPVPLHSEPLDDDNLLLVRRPCAQYHLELENVMKLPEIKEKLDKWGPMFAEVEEHTGMKIRNFDDAQDVFSTLLAEEGIKLPLPEWTKKYYPSELYEPTVFSYIVNVYNDKLKRLKGGVLLKHLINLWTSKKEGTIKPSERKAYLYGGHDSTIVNILNTLNVWDPQLPTYGITILMELSKDRTTNEFGLELYLRNTTEHAPYKLKIPGCDAFCPLDKVIELTKNVIPENWEEECKSDDPNYVPPPPGGP